MREMTATEASRNFKAVLDRTERGETIALTRGGKRIAVIAPADQTNGAAVRAAMRRWAEHPGMSDAADELAGHLAAARKLATAEADTDPWAE
ncbi:type II toxin-antitoxin system Phd/YefM family antitoxin [Sciscionella sediminilitoris]|uniref:type II toxin-antitoxin system Phd/YefM family antitoxin n=1 Tax=Sciscionella sediminilitoris TaxID=1445613 RepID=UPI0004DF25A3|nr:type II toxin-antitoxin system prevent-host-death family antitoxin [Sciscionella sp. SE31]